MISDTRWGVLASMVATGVLSVAGCAASTDQHASSRPAPRPAGFGWFTARGVPPEWHSAGLPDHTGVLSYPPTAVRVHADTGALATTSTATDGQLLVYLNATPEQGSESLTGWTRFRMEHLTEDDATTATLEQAVDSYAAR